jgi:peptidoglycan hydrolase-like protein with peptidoglycan-binding domain
MISTTNTIGKVAAVVAGLGLVASSFAAFAPVARAQSTTDLQAQIAMLMAQIQALQAQAGSSSSASVSMTFTKDLTVGSSGADVTALQNALISGGFLKIAKATGYFGPMTKAAVSAWQVSKNITPAAGYFGPKSRAAFGGVSMPTVPGAPVVTGTGLKVMLATDSPNNVALVATQSAGELAKFTFANPTSADIKVTKLAFNHRRFNGLGNLERVPLCRCRTSH